MNICVLCLDDVFDTGLTVLLDTLSTANELALAQGFAQPPFAVRLVGVRRRVRTALGFTREVAPLTVVEYPDWVIVPALNAKQPGPLLEALERRDVRTAIAQLRTWHADGLRIAAACIGTFLVAEAGVLDDMEATTTWSLAPLFRQRYPQVRLDDSRMIAASPRAVTAGAAIGHLDLALWMVRQASPSLADMVARFMLIDKRTTQSQYIVPDYLAHADPLISNFERWSRQNLANGFSLQAAAKALAVGPRTLQRRTDAILGKSPLAFFQDLRIQRAEQQLAAGHDLKLIAEEVGYADSATLRNLLRRRLGRGVRELRVER